MEAKILICTEHGPINTPDVNGAAVCPVCHRPPLKFDNWVEAALAMEPPRHDGAPASKLP